MKSLEQWPQNLFSVVAGILFIHSRGNCLVFIFADKTPSGRESQFASMCNLGSQLCGNEQVTGGRVVSVGWGLAYVDKSLEIDRIQRHLDTYIQTDPFKAPNEAVRHEQRRKLGGLML